MAAQQLETVYEDSWDPDSDSVEVNPDPLGDVNTIEIADDPKQESEFDVEVVDDPGVSDRDKKAKPLNDNPEPSEEELEVYSGKVKDRIGKLQHAYHDQRRAAEAAQRERDEAVAFARTVAERAKLLQKSADDSAEQQLEASIATAKRRMKEAADAYNTDEMAEAYAEMADLAAQKRAWSTQKTLAQQQDPVVQTRQPANQAAPAPDTRAQQWAAKNDKWFQKDMAATGFAFGLDVKLRSEGIDPTVEPDRYYEVLDARMRAKFPEHFEDAETQKQAPAKRQSSPVAPASRAAATRRKVTLTQSQMSLIRTLGITPEQYVKEMMAVEKQNG